MKKLLTLLLIFCSIGVNAKTIWRGEKIAYAKYMLERGRMIHVLTNYANMPEANRLDERKTNKWVEQYIVDENTTIYFGDHYGTGVNSWWSNHIYGTPGTSLQITAANISGVGAGDSILINTGTYTGMGESLNNVVIAPYGGIVNFIGQGDWGLSASSLKGVLWTTRGGLPIAFRYTGGVLASGSFNSGGTGNCINSTAGHMEQCWMDYTQFDSVTCAGQVSVGLQAAYNTTTYAGTPATKAWGTGGMRHYRYINMITALFQGSYGSPGSTYNNWDDSLEFAYGVDSLTNWLGGSATGSVVAGIIFHFNIHDNKCYTPNSSYIYEFQDGATFIIQGNGTFHHNFRYGGRCVFLRVFVANFKSIGNDTTTVYDNLLIHPWVYPFSDMSSSSAYYGASNTYVGPSSIIEEHNAIINGRDDGSTGTPPGPNAGWLTGLGSSQPFDGSATCTVNGEFTAGGQLTDSFRILSGTATLINIRDFTGAQIAAMISDTTKPYTVNSTATAMIGKVTNKIPADTVDYYYHRWNTLSELGPIAYVSGGSTSVTANAGSNQTITLPTSSVSLSASGSTVSGSTISSYLWSQTSGPNTASFSTPSSVGTNATGLIAGTYVFSVKVKDAAGDSSSASVNITVNSGNIPPISVPGSNQTINLSTTDSVILSGSGSYDPDGTIASYLWSQTTGPSSLIASATTAGTIIYFTGGTGIYTYSLLVTDNLGATNAATIIVIVNNATSTRIVRSPRRMIFNITH